jgi:hypothetical protein
MSLPFLAPRPRCVLVITLALSTAAVACNANPDGPRVPAQSGTDTPAPTDPPLPKKGRANPRGLQYVKPD